MKKIVILFFILLSQASADNTNYKEVSNEIYTEVFSPFCPGRSLKDCPSSKAEVLKKEIFEKVKSGKGKKDILNDIFRVYGDKYRALPSTSGFSLLAWLLPIGFLALGSFLFYFIFLNSKNKTEVDNNHESGEDSFNEVDKLL